MQRKKLLLVDDSKTVLMMEVMILQDGPYEFITALNGQDAVDKAVAHQPDLILLDVVMPVMDGLETCRRLRRLDGLRDTPIIIVTNRADAKQVAEAFESGCTSYLTKPINDQELLQKVQSQLGH